MNYASKLLQVKLLDFNPVFGTTSPLLFTWQELGYVSEGHGREGINEEPPAVLCSTEEAWLQHESNPEGGSQCNCSRNSEKSDIAKGSDWDSLASERSESTADALQPANSTEDKECVQLRVVLEANKVQPNMPMYGVPFDLIDNSDTGACTDLVEKLRGKHLT